MRRRKTLYIVEYLSIPLFMFLNPYESRRTRPRPSSLQTATRAQATEKLRGSTTAQLERQPTVTERATLAAGDGGSANAVVWANVTAEALKFTA